MPGNLLPEPIGERSGVRFILQTPESLYAAAESAQGGDLASALLPSPLRNLSISLESDGNTFDLQANFTNAIMSGDTLPAHKLLEAVVSQLVRRGGVYERGGNIITQGYPTNFVVASDHNTSGGLTFSTGGVRETISRTVRLIGSPQLEKDRFHRTLVDLLGIVSLATSISYGHAKSKPPEELIIVAPPKPGSKKDQKSGNVLDKITVERPNVSFDEIGGQAEAKREIMGLAAALDNPNAYRRWGTKPPKGILLYGPPGTGKTLMARALASQAKARFLHVQASDIGSKWYGDSEKIVQEIFDAASTGGKTIIYFDEIDAVSPSRQGAHEATRRVVSTLLQNIDGVGASDNVLLVASTNLFESVDSAMTRPGRFDRWVYVGLPDETARTQILGIHALKASRLAGRNLASGSLDLSAIAAQTSNFSGADLAEIVRRALEDKVRLEAAGKRPRLLTTKDLLHQVSHYERVHTRSATPEL